MDELKFKTDFMRGLISKLIRRSLRKKFGCEVNIRIKQLEVTSINDINDRYYVHMDVNGDIDIQELKKLLKEVGVEE